MALRKVTVAPLAAVLAAALVLAACGGEDSAAPAAEEQVQACAEVAAPEPKDVDLKRPKPLEPPPQGTVAVVETSCGEFEIELATERSPRTSASFAHLVEEGVYDNTAFHRIVPGFVIQGGDPRGDGTGGPGYFVDEPPPPDVVYDRGTVAMAKTAAEPPGRSGSQFYVVTAADAGLPADYAVLGEVVDGMATVEEIEALGDPAAGETGTPAQPVVIEKISLRRP